MVSERRAIGVMTGSSIDGLDAALISITGHGLGVTARLVEMTHAPLGTLAVDLRRLAEQTPIDATAIARLSRRFGELIADAVAGLAGTRPIDLVAVHGQTVAHAPPASWQLLSPAVIAERVRCPVVSDLRAADLAAGGQGAPITPLADWVLFRDNESRRAIVNLGGFANFTALPAGGDDRGIDGGGIDRIRGGDVCPANHLLDAAARRVLGRPFDEGGRAALEGRPDEEKARDLASRLAPSFDGRSLGPGDEGLAWIKAVAPQLDAHALLATVAEGVGACIGGAVRATRTDSLVIAGGGARHARLVAAIERAAGLPVQTSDAHGVPVEARESMAMAILGTLSADGIPITLPHITGCRTPAPVAGSWCLPGGLSQAIQ